MSAKTVELNNGYKIPPYGLGTWQSKPGEVKNAAITAIRKGYRMIDCAYLYGNEDEIGEAVKEVITEGTVKREDLCLVGKLWNTRHSPSDVRPSVQESLVSLGVDYLDLYLIHWPYAFKPGRDNFPKGEDGRILYADTHYLDTWKALEKCCDEGLIKALGVSNFNSHQIQDIIDNSRIKPANVQVEIHPYFPQEKLVKFCQDRGVVVTAYSPLGAPRRPWVKGTEPGLVDEPQIKAIAAKYNKTPAQVILRWLVDRNIIAIPKSVTPSRIEENFNVFDFRLSSEDMEVIKSLDKKCRLIAPMEQRDGKLVQRDLAAPFYPFHDHIEF